MLALEGHCLFHAMHCSIPPCLCCALFAVEKSTPALGKALPLALQHQICTELTQRIKQFPTLGVGFTVQHVDDVNIARVAHMIQHRRKVIVKHNEEDCTGRVEWRCNSEECSFFVKWGRVQSKGEEKQMMRPA